jgi:hypothetical protein
MALCLSQTHTNGIWLLKLDNYKYTRIKKKEIFSRNLKLKVGKGKTIPVTGRGGP